MCHSPVKPLPLHFGKSQFAPAPFCIYSLVKLNIGHMPQISFGRIIHIYASLMLSVCSCTCIQPGSVVPETALDNTYYVKWFWLPTCIYVDIRRYLILAEHCSVFNQPNLYIYIIYTSLLLYGRVDCMFSTLDGSDCMFSTLHVGGST